MPILDEAAAWISSLGPGDIPARVESKVRHQVLNMLAAALAGVGTGAGRRLAGGLPASGGNAWSLPHGRTYSLEEAITLGSALTMTLDYDDYLVFGHTGHSAVIASLVLGDREDMRLSEALPAVVAANEIAGRLGAATLLGPRNGQMWSYIHLAGGAAAAARVLGLDEKATCHALALALYQPTLPLYAGFMGGESKVLTASGPTLLGVQAALMAQAGLEGNPGILEGESGFLDELSFAPAPFFLQGWGRSWVSDTLAFKPYPGCAYLDTALDAWEEVRRELQAPGGEPLDPGDIESLRVEASLLTMGMDQLARTFRGSIPLAPVNVNFSLANSLALAVLNGRLTPSCLEPSYLEANGERVLQVASRIKLTHDWGATYELLEAMDRALGLAAVFRNFSRAQLSELRRGLRDSPTRAALGWRDLKGALSSLPPLFKRALLRAPLHVLPGSPRRSRPPGFDFGGIDLEGLRLPFPARLTLRLRDGRECSARCSIPRGAPGGPTYLEEVALKWRREAAPLLGEEGAGDVARLVLEEDPPLRELLDIIAPLPGGRG